jgi:hypothetical protein
VFAFPVLPRRSCAGVLSLIAVGLALSGCQTAKSGKARFAGIGMSSRECLTRVMYFESNRSSEDGMLGVGTVVMNRYASGKYGNSICAVIGAPRQFAPGVLSRAMTEPKSAARAAKIADEVLKGRRHPKVGKAEFFHTAGYEPGYNNMRYVSIEGGNAFYEKVKKGEDRGNLVRVARQGPADIGDIISVNETTMLAAVPVAVPPPVDEPERQPVYAPPPPQGTATRYQYPPPRNSRRDTDLGIGRAPPPRAVARAPSPLPPYVPPQAAEIAAAPQRTAARAPAPQYVPPQAAEMAPPGPELGWQVGPPGRVY